MELFSLALSIISLAAVGGLFYYFRKEIKKINEEILRQKTVFNKFILEDVMFAEDVGSKKLFKENVINLARKIFIFLKRRYGLKSTNYAELIEELKKLEIKQEFKNQLIEFFDSIILLEYSKNALSESEKKELKKKAVNLIKKMGHIPALPE